MSAANDHDPILTGDSTVSAVIAGFVRATDPHGDRRELRAALSHVEAELGTMPVRAVRTRHVTALLDELRRAGLSPRRETAIVEALRSLYAFAVARGLVAVSPIGEPARRPTAVPRPPRRPADEPRTPPRARAAPVPTLTMLALGARVAFWTTWIIMLGFIALLVLLVVEFG